MDEGFRLVSENTEIWLMKINLKFTWNLTNTVGCNNKPREEQRESKGQNAAGRADGKLQKWKNC